MPAAAVVSAASIGSALIGSSAANKAAKQQAQAAAQARQDMLPFMLPGQGAIAGLAQLHGINPQTGAFDPTAAFNPESLAAFRNYPGYQFAFGEGLRALENSKAAQGMLKSGNTLRAITEYGQGLADQTFGRYTGTLGQLAQMGMGAAGGAGQAAMQQGNALASGAIGGANAWTGALGNIGNFFMMQNAQNQQQQFLQSLIRPQGTGTAYAPSMAPQASQWPAWGGGIY